MFSSVIEVCSHWSMLLTCMIWLAREKVAAILPALRFFSITAIGGRPHGATRGPQCDQAGARGSDGPTSYAVPKPAGAGRGDLPP